MVRNYGSKISRPENGSPSDNFQLLPVLRCIDSTRSSCPHRSAADTTTPAAPVTSSLNQQTNLAGRSQGVGRTPQIIEATPSPAKPSPPLPPAQTISFQPIPQAPFSIIKDPSLEDSSI